MSDIDPDEHAVLRAVAKVQRYVDHAAGEPTTPPPSVQELQLVLADWHRMGRVRDAAAMALDSGDELADATGLLLGDGPAPHTGGAAHERALRALKSWRSLR